MFGDKYLPPAFPRYDDGSSEEAMVWSQSYMHYKEAVKTAPTPVRRMLESRNSVVKHIGAVTAAALEVIQDRGTGSAENRPVITVAINNEWVEVPRDDDRD